MRRQSPVPYLPSQSQLAKYSNTSIRYLHLDQIEHNEILQDSLHYRPLDRRLRSLTGNIGESEYGEALVH